ncbi:thiamine-phosphate pyrophosphorylase [Virgibacillus natechei]|uniref:Thiamine-phosphate synthase n=1 Tax=Virgibacillus natechei TaxID=1216297 RepID=A0ABS4IBV8_9BACI|nr:thiamine phosphate synthase [Virgibacillus natechei]MBP1968419.1 thiamine-phosphate pyrophosphorylase [Virgibacillus natechei]UZD13542.1 thiamine phosphate synthase [Virgibacillus natechei]
MMPPLRQSLRKYFIMGSQNCDQDPVQILESAANSGITAFQFREKGEGSLTGDAKLELGKRLREVCRQHNIPFIVNDDVDLACLLHADGIHVGQDDSSVEEIRKHFPDKIIGLSLSNADEVAKSPISIIDYIGAGPVFATNSKADAKATVGVEWMTALRKQFPDLPIVGIGGITTDNANSVIKAGADGVSVISAITKAKNTKEAVRAL